MGMNAIVLNAPNIEKFKKELPERCEAIRKANIALDRSMIVSEKSLERRIRI